MSMQVFNGALIRTARNTWQWADGTPEPRVRDLSPDEWNFRCTTFGNGAFAEVLYGIALETPTLRWVVDGYRSGRYRPGRSGHRTGEVVLTDEGLRRSHIQPGEDPLLGNEPLPESPGPIPRVALVPIAEWNEWCRENPAGAEWNKEHEPDILAIAKSQITSTYSKRDQNDR